MKARFGSALLFLSVLVIGAWTVHYFWKTPPKLEPETQAGLESGLCSLAGGV